MQRPQLGLLHRFTSWLELWLNLALVNSRFKLFGCRLLLINLKLDNTLFILGSSCRMGKLKLITLNISGFLGL